MVVPVTSVLLEGRKPPDGQAETGGARVLRRLNQWNRIATTEDVLARERR